MAGLTGVLLRAGLIGLVVDVERRLACWAPARVHHGELRVTLTIELDANFGLANLAAVSRVRRCVNAARDHAVELALQVSWSDLRLLGALKLTVGGNLNVPGHRVRAELRARKVPLTVEGLISAGILGAISGLSKAGLLAISGLSVRGLLWLPASKSVAGLLLPGHLSMCGGQECGGSSQKGKLAFHGRGPLQLGGELMGIVRCVGLRMSARQKSAGPLSPYRSIEHPGGVVETTLRPIARFR